MATVHVSTCYCGKPLKEHTTELKSWTCHHCWRKQTNSVYFQCGDCPNCDNEVGDRAYDVCAECVESASGAQSGDDDKSDNGTISARLMTSLDRMS